MPAPSPLHMQKAWLSPQDLPFHSRSCTLVYLLMGLFSSSKGVSSFHHFPDLCFTLVNKSPERGYKAAMICTRTGRDVFHDCLLMSSFSCFCQCHCVCTWNLLGDFSTHLLLINRLPMWPASFPCWVPCWLIKLHATKAFLLLGNLLHHLSCFCHSVGCDF